MVFGIKYCKECMENIERENLGYSPQNEDCGRWQCHLLDWAQIILVTILFIPLIVFLVPILLALVMFSYIRDDGYVQEPASPKTIPKRMGRKKSRK
jgi:hypothetical protein